MASLADVFVTGRIDTRQFGTDIKKGMASPSVAAASTDAGKTAGGKFKSSFGGALKGIAAPLVAGLGVAAVGTFLKGSIDEAQQAAKVGQQTAAVLKSTRGEAGLTSTAIGDLANALSKKAGIDDEVIQSGENVLLTFTNIRDEVGKGNDIFSQATAVALDMSSALGTDLQGSVIQVGKALNDPIKGITALQRVGVSFTQQQRDQIAAMVASGDTMKAQKTILAELNKEFGGSAAAQATASDHLSVSIGNLKESIGTELLPVVNNLAVFLNEKGIPALSATGTTIKNDVVPPVKLVVGVVGDAVDVFKGLPGPVQDSAKALGLAAVAVLALKRAGATGVGKSLVGQNGLLGELRLQSMIAREEIAKTAGVIPKLGTAATFAARGGVGLLAKAGTGLVGALGGPWGLALTGGIAAVGLFASAHSKAAAEVEALKATLDQQTGAITKNTREWVVKKLNDDRVLDSARTLGVDLGLVTDATLGQKDAVANLNNVLDVSSPAFDKMKAAATANGVSARDFDDAWLRLTNTVGSAGDSIRAGAADIRLNNEAMKHWQGGMAGANLTAKDLAKVTPTVTDTARHMGGVVEETGRAFHSQKTEVKAAKDELVGYRSVSASLISKQIGLSQAIIDAKNALKDNKDGFDKNTAAGIKNYQVVLDLAAATEGFSGKTDSGRAAIEKARQAIIDYTHAQGMSIPGAERLATRLLGVADAGKKVHDTDATMKVDADTANATSKVKKFQEDAKRFLHGIPDEPVGIHLSTSAQRLTTSMGTALSGLAAGGPISGGVAGRDSVPALLMPGEHVWTADEVSKAGGHGVIMGLRRLAKLGELPRRGDISAFAEGGPVLMPSVSSSGLGPAVGAIASTFGRIADAVSARLSKVISDKITSLPAAGMLGPGGNLTLAQMARGQAFAKAQVGKPYVWGGVGPSGYDCSGYQSAILNSAVGVNPYSRRGSTASMPWAGSHPGVGRYTIGWTADAGGGIGHTAGNIGGLNVESYGGHGPAVGSGARGPLDPMFAGLMHYDSGGILPHNGAGVNVSGHAEAVLDPEQTKAFRDLARAAAHFRVSGSADRSAVSSDLSALYGAIRSAFGKDAPLLKAVHDLGNKMVDAARERDHVAAQLSKATDQLHSIRQAERQFESSTRSAFTASPFAQSGAQTVQGMRAYLRDSLAKTQDFAGAERRLIDKGLSHSLIRQLVGEGPDALGRAQSLAGLSRKELHQFSRLAARQVRSAGRVATLAGGELFDDRETGALSVVRHLRRERAQITRELELYAAVAVREVTHRLGHHAAGPGAAFVQHVEHQHVADGRDLVRKADRKAREHLAIAGGS